MRPINRKFWGHFSTFVLSLGLNLTLVLLNKANASTTEDIVKQMNVFQAFILGMVQGATEFLPISSTAHLKVVPVVLGWGDPGVTFTAVIQLGSIAAVIWYFWQDLKQITTGMILAVKKRDYKAAEYRLAIGIILGTMPILLCGFLLKILVPDLDNSPIRSLIAIACASIIMSLLLGVAEKISKHERDYEQLNERDGILMGVAQALALIPGVSRSGSTITAGLFMNLQRSTAARFSFLLGIPAITLAGLVELKEVFQQGVDPNQWIPLIVGVISSALFSYLAIAWLIKYLQTKNTWVFVWYRLIFGLLIIGAVAIGLLPN